MLQMPHLFTLLALIGFVCFASPLLLLGPFDCWLGSGSQLSLRGQAPSPRATSPCALGLPPKTPSSKRRVSWPGLTGGGLCGLHNLYQILFLPHQGIYLLLLIPELFGQFILLGGGYCVCCCLSFRCCLGLTCLPLFF